MKLHIKKGDTVAVISGSEANKRDKDGKRILKTGKVLQVLVKKNRAIVEGVNMVKKATKPSAQNTEGGIIEKEAPIHISNLMLICPETGKPTRIGRKVVGEGKDKKIVRYSKKSKNQEEIK